MKYFTTKKSIPMGKSKGKIVENMKTSVKIPIEKDY